MSSDMNNDKKGWRVPGVIFSLFVPGTGMMRAGQMRRGMFCFGVSLASMLAIPIFGLWNRFLFGFAFSFLQFGFWPIYYTNQGAKGMTKDGDVYFVDKGRYFILGDDSDNSSDSRYWGYVPRELIIGRVSKIYFPFSRMGRVCYPGGSDFGVYHKLDA
jgi:hypothetical protein